MSYNDEAVSAKLASLNETQDAITTVAQWVMFHRRHADRTVELWMARLNSTNSSKRLNLIYLANEVIQQSKARKRTEFLTSFSPVIGEAVATAFRSATNDVQEKLRRVVEVWRQRGIFESPVQENIESRMAELDKARAPGGKRPTLGGSLFGNSLASAMPPEIVTLASSFSAAKKAALPSQIVDAASTAYEQDYVKSAETPPAPPVHVAKLSTLVKTLASAEGAVAEGMKARAELITSLEKLLSDSRSQQEQAEQTHTSLQTKKEEAEAKKRELEDGIMQGLATEGPLATMEPGSTPPRPDVESFTPPPPDLAEDSTTTGAHESSHEPYSPPPNDSIPKGESSIPVRRPSSSGSGDVGGLSKKRRVDDIEDGSAIFGTGNVMDDLDDDVAAMLEKT